MKKIYHILILTLVILCVAVIPAFAEQKDQIQTDTKVISDNGSAGDGIVAAADHPPADGVISNESNSPQADGQTVSGVVLSFFEQKGKDICSILTLTVSVLLAWLFKRGVLPSLTGAFGRLSDQLKEGLSSLTTAGATLSKETKKSIDTFLSDVTPTLNAMQDVAKNAETTAMSIALMEKELAKACREREQTKQVLTAQMTLFYQFFMAVNLPQYQKDRLGECYSRLLSQMEAEPDHDTKA